MSSLYFLCFALQTILESVEEKAAFTISLNIFVLRAHREPEDLNSGNYGINRLALLAISYSFQSFYLRFFCRFFVSSPAGKRSSIGERFGVF